MPESSKPQQQTHRGTFVERFVRRILTSFGALFGRLFGGGTKPDALPSTLDLSERLKRLIDAGVKEQTDGSRLAPHLIRLKYAWGQNSDEFLAALKRLKNELLVVSIDHINDNRYRTLAPVKIEDKSDILTEGFNLSVGFDASDAAAAEHVEIPASIFASLLPPVEKPEIEQTNEIQVSASAQFSGTGNHEFVLRFVPDGKHNLTVGRSKEHNLNLEDDSVSKLHASLVMDSEGKLRVADIGSTNGTYLKGERIAYGKAYDVFPGDSVSFGEVPVSFNWEIPQIAVQAQTELTVDSGDDENEEMETAVNKEAETMVRSSEEPETVFKSREVSVYRAAETEVGYDSMSDFSNSSGGSSLDSPSSSDSSDSASNSSD